MIIETKNLYCRPFVESDFDEFYAIQSDEELMKYFSGAVQNKVDAREEFDSHLLSEEKNGYSLCALSRKDDFNKIVGYAGLTFDQKTQSVRLDYLLHKEFWGNGYGAEIALAVVDWGFKNIPNCDKIFAGVDPKNKASVNILREKIGMKVDLVLGSGRWWCCVEKNEFMVKHDKRNSQ